MLLAAIFLFDNFKFVFRILELNESWKRGVMSNIASNASRIYRKCIKSVFLNSCHYFKKFYNLRLRLEGGLRWLFT
jgi:hypothetical protein